MNRVYSLGSSSVAELVPAAESTALSAGKRSCSAPLSVFVPLHYEPNYAYPLVVWLHGPGDDERQLHRIMPHVSLRNFVAVGPRGTCSGSQLSPRERGFTWRQTDDEIDQAETRVLEAIEHVRSRFHVHQQRIFLAGYESGGTMALRLGLQWPELFAGVISMSGEFPQGLAPLNRLKQVKQLPLLVTYARDSKTYAVEQVCRNVQLFHIAGLGVSLRQYPCGDEMTTKMLLDINAWIMERVTGIPAEPENAPVSSSQREWN